MSLHKTITLAAAVDEAERMALHTAAEMLGDCLARAGGNPHPVRVQFVGSNLPLAVAPVAIIASLLPDVANAREPIEDTERRWRERVKQLQVPGVPVFIMTVFRHVNERRHGGHEGARIVERIRRLNRMAADLSHDQGVGVVDIDQAFAHVGARLLGTSYRLSGGAAARLAGHTIARALLSFGLDNAIDSSLQVKARAALGSLEKMSALLEDEFVHERTRQQAAGTGT